MADNRPGTKEARRQRIVTLLSENLSDRAIAERLGLSVSTVQRHRRGAGVKLRPHGSLPGETVAEIHRLYEEEGWPPGEIADTLGITADVVYRRLGKTTTGPEWNKVARWAAEKHPKLWEELKA